MHFQSTVMITSLSVGLALGQSFTINEYLKSGDLFITVKNVKGCNGQTDPFSWKAESFSKELPLCTSATIHYDYKAPEDKHYISFKNVGGQTATCSMKGSIIPLSCDAKSADTTSGASVLAASTASQSSATQSSLQEAMSTGSSSTEQVTSLVTSTRASTGNRPTGCAALSN